MDIPMNTQTFINDQKPVNMYTDANNNGSSAYIKDFYDDATIFVTGATGFLGKVLIEKLLRSCDGLRSIIILLRPKRGLSCEQRFTEFIKNPVFDRIRAKTPERLDKVEYIFGDINLAQVGLGDQDIQRLIEEVNIVFHVAATVRFNESLQDAANLNTLGTKRIMELCTKMTCLKSIVHVSTAYSNPLRKNVGELVYPPHCPVNEDVFLKCMDVLPGEVLNMVTDKFQGIVMEIGRGTITSVMGEKKFIVDLIPVDMVVNTMITAAWNNANFGSKSVRVYNCTSGQINPITWQDFGILLQKYWIKHPTKYAMLYPSFSYRTNYPIHKIIETFLHILPAYVFDIIMRLQGKKPIMMKIARKFQKAGETGTFFATHEFIFENTNLRQLVSEVKTMKDGNEFYCDMSNIDWESYLENYMLGIRKYVLKDGLESLPSATGFLGKVLVEKLLYSCPDIGKIYILIRDRRGTPAKERFHKFISNSIFDRIRSLNPKILEKLNLIEGDCLFSDLGIKNPEELKINIIFHVVATVKFNEKLETAIDVNVNGTIRILELAKKMSDLESFVYISTAYSIPYKSHVEEKVQRFDLIGNFSTHIVENELKLTESQLNSLSVNIGAEKLYPNTYTITKHMAEQVVYDFSKESSGIDVIIVRPSIITAAAYEPIIGWIDSFNGPSAMMVEISRGTIKSVIGNGNVIADLIPVDIVTNTIIVSVWHQKYFKR
uniref:Fatty acyl-CoA reductase n=1 Tax=Culicoides sonorensis TaxID=179676 RepID=A0A336MJD1_CULSO